MARRPAGIADALHDRRDAHRHQHGRILPDGRRQQPNCRDDSARSIRIRLVAFSVAQSERYVQCRGTAICRGSKRSVFDFGEHCQCDGVAVGSVLFLRWLNYHGLADNTVPLYTQWAAAPEKYIRAFQSSWLMIVDMTSIAVATSAMHGADVRTRENA
jgi:hypothetical protein